MLNLFLIFFGSIGLLVGVALTPTPVPGTTLLIVLSLGTLIHSSCRAEKLIRGLRERFKWINSLFFEFEKLIDKKPNGVAKTLKKTRPKK